MGEDGEIVAVKVKSEEIAKIEVPQDVFDSNRGERYAYHCANEGKALKVESFCLFLGEICNLIRSFGKIVYFAFSGKI